MTNPPATLPDVNPFLTTPRHFVGGMVIGLLLVGVMVGIRALVTDEPPPPSEWLTEADQEDLVGAMDEVNADGRWVAGCVWEHRSPDDIDEVVDSPKGETRFWRAHLPGGRRASLVTVEGAGQGSDFNQLVGLGYFCYLPVSADSTMAK